MESFQTNLFTLNGINSSQSLQSVRFQLLPGSAGYGTLYAGYSPLYADFHVLSLVRRKNVTTTNIS